MGPEDGNKMKAHAESKASMFTFPKHYAANRTWGPDLAMVPFHHLHPSSHETESAEEEVDARADPDPGGAATSPSGLTCLNSHGVGITAFSPANSTGRTDPFSHRAQLLPPQREVPPSEKELHRPRP